MDEVSLHIRSERRVASDGSVIELNPDSDDEGDYAADAGFGAGNGDSPWVALSGLEELELANLTVPSLEGISAAVPNLQILRRSR